MELRAAAFFPVFRVMDAAMIEQEALNLSTAERALLADRLLQTLDQEDTDRLRRWGEEADRRLDAFERGEIEAVDGPAALAKLRGRLG